MDAGPNSTITPGGATWGTLSRAQAIPWTQDLLTGSRNSYTLTSFYTLLKNNFVPTGRLPIFHYAIAGAEMSATCGGGNPLLNSVLQGAATGLRRATSPQIASDRRLSLARSPRVWFITLATLKMIRKSIIATIVPLSWFCQRSLA